MQKLAKKRSYFQGLHSFAAFVECVSVCECLIRKKADSIASLRESFAIARANCMAGLKKKKQTVAPIINESSEHTHSLMHLNPFEYLIEHHNYVFKIASHLSVPVPCITISLSGRNFGLGKLSLAFSSSGRGSLSDEMRLWFAVFRPFPPPGD